MQNGDLDKHWPAVVEAFDRLQSKLDDPALRALEEFFDLLAEAVAISERGASVTPQD